MRHHTFNKSNFSLEKFLNTRDVENDFLSTAITNAKHKCEFCGSEGEHVHHIIPKSQGGENKLTNLIFLCEKCHLKAHNGDYFNHNGLNEVMKQYFQNINDNRYSKSMPEIIEYFELLKNKARTYKYTSGSRKSMFFYAGKYKAYEEILELLLKLEK